jgi:hypothetical protein
MSNALMLDFKCYQGKEDRSAGLFHLGLWETDTHLRLPATDNGEDVRRLLQYVGESNRCYRIDLVRIGNLAQNFGKLDFDFVLVSGAHEGSQIFTLLLPLLELRWAARMDCQVSLTRAKRPNSLELW